jgi:hypothetical protein
MKRVQHVRVVSFAHLQALLAALVGFIAGILYSFGGAVYDIFTTGVNMGTALAFLALIGMPVTFGACGFVLGLVEAVLFNAFAQWVGGVSIDFMEDQ